MKLKAQSSKLKISPKMQATKRQTSPSVEADLGALSLEFLLSFELWLLSF